METIEANYDFTPVRFTNGTVVNEAGTNSGSCKLFSFAKLHQLSKEETLACFGDYYRVDVLQHPDADPEQWLAIKGIGPWTVSYARLRGLSDTDVWLGGDLGVQKALAKAGLKIEDMDVIEANEAFAAQACAVSKELGLDPAKVNPNGSGISLGHPIGATGALITVKALYELQRINGRYALVTMCIGGGQGIAAIFERV